MKTPLDYGLICDHCGSDNITVDVTLIDHRECLVVICNDCGEKMIEAHKENNWRCIYEME